MMTRSFVSVDISARMLLLLVIESNGEKEDAPTIDNRAPAFLSFYVNFAFFIPIGHSMLLSCRGMCLFTFFFFLVEIALLTI
jgi:hypothetical protein